MSQHQDPPPAGIRTDRVADTEAGPSAPLASTSVPDMVVADGVWKSFGGLDILKGVSLTVARGEVLCLIGPSGSGKSTFLRCINHLERVNAGRLWVDGELIGYRERGGRLHEMHPHEVHFCHDTQVVTAGR